MKSILCFGDSNTFGYIPNSGKRYGKDVRWTSILKDILKPDFGIMEAGCNNRTSYTDNPDGDIQTGYKAIRRYFSINPDIIIISLGINDLQRLYNPTIEEFREGFEQFIKTVRANCTSEIVITAPPILDDNVLRGNFSFQFDKSSVEKSKFLPDMYKTISIENDCKYIDFNHAVRVSELDGLHYSPDGHLIIAKLLSEFIRAKF